MRIKQVTAVTVLWNMRDVLTSLNIVFPPGNAIFAIAYAARDEKNRFPSVPATDVNTVLNMYLEKGTRVPLIRVNRSWKFLKVGLDT